MINRNLLYYHLLPHDLEVNMKIGLLFDDKGFINIDLRYPERGNPGVGGTQFCFLMLSRYLNKNYPDVEVTYYHYNNNIFSNNIRSIIVDNLEMVVKNAKQDGIDILIFTSVTDISVYSLIDKYKIKSIVWAHNYLFLNQLNAICKSNYVKRVVFVGKQQYDRYIDHQIIKKSQYIYNMFNSKEDSYRRNPNYEKIVSYTGSMIKQKGFHILAKQWKSIVKRVPEAKLYIIGSGKLYNRNAKLGTYNIADEDYEKQFIKYLVDKQGNILPSVKFLGVLGQEKVEVFQNTAVGVINPSARTETFGLSAVEMSACGIPIVSKCKNGLPDTIKNHRTGLLYYFNCGLKRRVIKLLLNKDLNNKLGNNAKKYVNEYFSPDNIIKEWYKLFNDILKDKTAEYYKPTDNYLNNMKFIRIINRSIKKLAIFSKLPAIVNYECWLKSIILRCLKK